MPGKILTYIRSITVVFLLTVAAFSAKVYSTDIIPAAKQADSLGLTTDILKIESGDYSGRDKEGLICFLRQESATAGTMNFEKLGLTESDTLAWDTDESWIGELTSSGFLTWDEGTTPYKLQDIIFTGKELGGHLDASFFQALTRLFVGDNALRRLSVSNPNLYTLYCGSNKLSSLDLSECAALEVIDCSGNQLIELKLHPDNYIYNLNCINNRLRFSSLPKLVRQPNYKYSPQAAIDGGELPPRKIIGFDKEYEVVNNGSTYTTSFTWTATPSSPVLTDLTKGLFRTEISNIGQSFVCELKNSYFPDLTLTYSVKVVERETPYYIYNEGVLSLTDKMPDNTLLYVGGDLYAGTDIVSGSNPAEVRNTSEIITEKSRTVLTGNFYNNVKSGTVFDGSKRIAGDPSIFEFRGDEAQTITTKGNSYAAIPSKKTNYIDFPNVRINNNKHVTLDASLAAKTQNIGLDKGWLILDSRKVDGRDYPTSLPNDRSVMAHLLVDGSVDYGDWTGKEPEDRGFIQVNLALDNDEMQGETDPKYDNRKYRSLVGLGTPFHNMKADYFMFNFLMAPTNVSFLGDNKSTIVDPNYTLEAGRGYGLGIDLRGTDASQYTDIAWAGIDFGQRSSGMHYFNRHKFANDPGRSANQIFGTNLSDSAYAEEKLTTENVSVKLNKKGFHYLANPFMSPLNLNDLLGSNTSSDWGIVSDNQGNSSGRDMLNRIWILKGDSKGIAKYKDNRIKVVYNYYIAKGVGGTYLPNDSPYPSEDGDDDNVTIAPLQMFVVYTVKDNLNFTIPKDKRVMGTTPFIRSKKEGRYDDFIIEVMDKETGMTDRANVVLRPQNEIDNNFEYRNVKKLSTVVANDGNSNSAMLEGEVTPTIFSQLYTLDDKDNSALTVNFLPIETTSSVPLYMDPASLTQNISIRGLRLNTKRDVEEIYLEDKVENKIIELTPETVYETYSEPTMRTDRFVLHFKEPVPNIDDNTDKRPLWANYNNNILTIQRFIEKDFDSDINVFDMNGKNIIRTKVNGEIMNIPYQFIPGVYIIKIKGTRNQVIKLIVG